MGVVLFVFSCVFIVQNQGVDIELALMILFSVALIAIGIRNYDANAKYEALLNTISQNADQLSFYVDGIEVEYENINMDYYEITYEKETGKVFLTKWERS